MSTREHNPYPPRTYGGEQQLADRGHAGIPEEAGSHSPRAKDGLRLRLVAQQPTCVSARQYRHRPEREHAHTALPRLSTLPADRTRRCKMLTGDN